MLATSAAFAAPTLERVTFTSYDLDAHGMPLELRGQLFRPEGASSARLPAVVALHGCGGMYSIVKARRNVLTLRHRAMADLLTAEGYAVLFPDSFRPRGREQICSVPAARQPITQRNRLLDTLGALAYLQGRSDIDGEHVAVLGWSHGGTAVLAAMNARDPLVQRYRSEAATYFRTGIAFYPGCFGALRARTGYAPASSLLLLVAGSDDWTSPRPCIALVDRLRAAQEPASIVVYPDAYHGFDGPDGEPRRHLDLPNGVHPGQGVTLAVNPAARDDAYLRVRAALREALGTR